MIKIRKAEIKDCRQVYELCRVPGLVNPSGEPPKIWWIESFIKEKQMFYVAETNKDIIGFVIGERTCGNLGYLWMLAIKKEFQGKGLGKKLLKLAERECRRRKLKAIICYGFAKNNRALKLLKKQKYEQGEKYYEFIKFLKSNE